MTSQKETLEQADKPENILQLVSFVLDEEEFGVDILAVQEIIRMHEITKVPNSPHFVEGVINLRGRILPVIDLRKRLGLPPKPYDKGTRIIVVELLGRTVGFIVDAVAEVLRIPASVTEAPPQMVSNIDSEFITSVGKLDDRLLILLDLSKIFSKNEYEMLS